MLHVCCLFSCRSETMLMGKSEENKKLDLTLITLISNHVAESYCYELTEALKGRASSHCIQSVKP